MKKRLWIYPVICFVLGAVAISFYKPIRPAPEFDFSALWTSKRKLPEKIALDGYLAGNVARTNHDLDRAVQAYLKVLSDDPDNNELWNDTYVMAMLQGIPETIMPHLDKIQGNKMLVDYARSVDAFKRGDLEGALVGLPPKQPHGVDSLLTPLMRAWIYAKQDNKEKAWNTLNTLKNHPFAVGYHKVLLGTFLKDDDWVGQGINQIGDNSIPAIGYFPLLKKVIDKTGDWEMSALKKKYQDLEKTYPATADLLVQIGQTDLTAEQGMAETLYFVSALGGGGQLTREEALALNSMALYLQPDKQMSLVWGAELSEGLQLPKVALSYYKRLTFHSATLRFKEAADLMLVNQTDKAVQMLEVLEKTNRTSIPLLTLLGQAYQEQKQTEKALAIYNRLIPLLEETPKNAPLIQAYMMRGILYGSDHSDQMLMDLKKAQVMDPENAMLLNDLGYHQLESGEVEEGFDLVQKAHQKKPQDPYILDSLAFGYWKKGQANVALPLAERALDLMPQSALINAHLGDIYETLGRRREASFQYKKALDLKTDLTEIQITELDQKINELKRKGI